jgi:hypothetical protein
MDRANERKDMHGVEAGEVVVVLGVGGHVEELRAAELDVSHLISELDLHN